VEGYDVCIASVQLRSDVVFENKQERTDAAEVVSCFRLSKGNKSVSIEIRNQGRCDHRLVEWCKQAGG
jgi:hypothetical protein